MPAMSINTIEITEGIQQQTSRLALKKMMQPFGEVDACHMGDRAVMGDRFTEFPIVRYKSQTAAETCLAALKSGQVFLDGYKLNGEWRGGGGQSVRQRKGASAASSQPPRPNPAPYQDVSSRDLVEGRERASFAGRDLRRLDREEFSSRALMDGRAGGDKGKSDDRRRSPSRKRSRSRRRGGSRKRSASRRRRSPSRSRSHKTKNGGSSSGAAALLAAPMKLGAIKAHTSPTFGNLEDSMSPNPLFKGQLLIPAA